MPIYEIESDRVVPVPSMQPAPVAFLPEARSVVEHHLDSLLGEPVMPVHHALPDEDAPYLTALDAYGAVVVVELVGMLDDSALVAALGRAGRAGGQSRGELVAGYDHGPEAFGTDHAMFLARVPSLGATQPHVRTGGVRLVLVCASAGLTTVDALDFLRQPGMQVDVFRLGVVRAPDGRRYVDVSPLGDSARGPRGMESMPSAASSVSSPSARTAHAPAASAPAGPDTPAPARMPVGGGAAAVAPAAAVQATAAAGYAAAMAHVPAGVALASVPALAPGSAIEVDPNPVAPVVPAPSVGVRPVADPRGSAAAVVSPTARAKRTVTLGASGAGSSTTPRLGGPTPSVTGAATHPAAFAGARSRARLASVEETSIDTNPNDLSTLRESSRSYAAAMSYGSVTEPTPPPRGPRQPIPQGWRDAALKKLAGRLEEPTPLLWVRHRRNERFEVTLHPDGVIELPDGRRFMSPDVAATIVSDAEHTVDGWGAWRVGEETGPTLRDLRAQG
ncbi:hypothetical protein HF995_12430 [Sanguibacter hominis ATCC BAA-789]|uniref:RAMA domain-containing protein n=1 Tax=Sanguibacter hominis ATCC BAA-789 TaxID=1312740 RepID=A0A9X5FCX0_9MICO|nr:hypothetical protein [Sanguibacter hominis]NKX94065.1 hypothetical protein [Sanguibacter hominis ATCC BAA-789]